MDDMTTPANIPDDAGNLTFEKMLEAYKILKQPPEPIPLAKCAGCEKDFPSNTLAWGKDGFGYCCICWTMRYIGEIPWK